MKSFGGCSMCCSIAEMPGRSMQTSSFQVVVRWTVNIYVLYVPETQFEQTTRMGHALGLATHMELNVIFRLFYSNNSNFPDTYIQTSHIHTLLFEWNVPPPRAYIFFFLTFRLFSSLATATLAFSNFFFSASWASLLSLAISSWSIVFCFMLV